MDTPLWIQIWEQKLFHIAAFTVFLILIILVMLFRDSMSKRKQVLNILKYGILGISFFYVGLVLKAQPTTTNIIILITALKELQFPLGLYLMEPFIFLSFIFIFLTIILWGRGVFCGWLCPYGAMLELLNRIYHKLFPKGVLYMSDRVHNKLIYLKYIIFLLIFGASFYSFMLSEYMTEVEPFRTFVLKLNREWYFVLYFSILTAGSMIIYRAFCRYLCPLGAALAIPALIVKIPLIKMRRYDFCSTCRICARTCTPKAIMSDGIIDRRECMNCLDCQVNFWDEDVCPVLIKRKRLGGTASQGQEESGVIN
jgi:NosR/NirI family nitrous oxide reductase transcriptional regulator